jgi:hypothetical protein
MIKKEVPIWDKMYQNIVSKDKYLQTIRRKRLYFSYLMDCSKDKYPDRDISYLTDSDYIENHGNYLFYLGLMEGYLIGKSKGGKNEIKG